MAKQTKKLECLMKLQKALKEKFELENTVESLPKKLREEEDKLKRLSSDFLRLTEEFNAAREEEKSLTIRYEDAFALRTKYEKQAEFVTTNREMDALLKQQEEAKSQENTLHKARNAKQQQVEKLREELDKRDEECRVQQEIVDKEREKVSESVDSIYHKIDALNQELNKLKGNDISEELFERFSIISKRKNGEGIVPVHGQVCTGCNMVLPMQFVIDLRKKEENNEIEQCPYCSRVIYYEPLDPQEERKYIFVDIATSIDSLSSEEEIEESTKDEEILTEGEFSLD